jgi:hypothetical protein
MQAFTLAQTTRPWRSILARCKTISSSFPTRNHVPLTLSYSLMKSEVCLHQDKRLLEVLAPLVHVSSCVVGNWGILKTKKETAHRDAMQCRKMTGYEKEQR